MHISVWRIGIPALFADEVHPQQSIGTVYPIVYVSHGGQRTTGEAKGHAECIRVQSELRAAYTRVRYL